MQKKEEILKVEILSVGTELLMGQIANTNAQFISRHLPEVGLGVFYHSVVGDNPQRLTECLHYALSRSDVIITTGGLGPTQDDLTKEVIAEALGLEMLLDTKSAEEIKNYFEKLGKVMTENNIRQAYFPKGCKILDNDEGTAPGCMINHNDKIIILLPGPPKELIPMFNKHVIPYFRERCASPLTSKFLRVVGIGESMVEKKLLSLVDGQTNPTIATYAKDGIVTIRVTAHDEGEIPAALLVSDMCGKISSILGDSVYTDNDEDIEFTVFKLLAENKLTFSCAESCTGGMLSEKITSIPGSSQVFKCGTVTYMTSSKTEMLDVDPETINKYGVVSKETALAMVQGIIQKSATDVAVSITGYAGPQFADEPVGKVCIAVCAPGCRTVKEFRFSGNRDRIRTLSVINALDMVRRALLHLDLSE